MRAGVPSASSFPRCSTTRRSHRPITRPHLVLDQQHGEVELVADARDQVANSIRSPWIEAGGRLVEQQEARLRCERARDLDALQRAVGKVAGARCSNRSRSSAAGPIEHHRSSPCSRASAAKGPINALEEAAAMASDARRAARSRAPSCRDRCRDSGTCARCRARRSARRYARRYAGRRTRSTRPRPA